MQKYLDSNLRIEEPEIATILLGNLIETFFGVIKYGSDWYRRKTMVVVTGNNNWTGSGMSCGNNSKNAITGAARKARLRTNPRIISGNYIYIDVFIGPSSGEILASTILKFIVNLLGIRRRFAVSNSEMDTMILIAAHIEALRETPKQ